MKRVLFALFSSLVAIVAGNAAEGPHAYEIFTEDVVLSDAIIPANEYEQAIFRGNLTIDCSVVGQQSFKEAIIFGDVSINAKIISPEAFKNAIIKGKLTINDDATIDGTAFVNENEGKVIDGDLTIDEWMTGYEQYSCKIILGDVTIKRSSLYFGYAFSGAKIVGNLTIERSAMSICSFSASTIIGDVNIERALVSEYSFYGANIIGDLNVERALVYENAFNNIKVNGAEKISETAQFFDKNSYYDSDSHGRETKDIVIEDAILKDKSCYGKLFCGDVVLDNSIAEDHAFQCAIILGDIYLKNSVFYPEACYLAQMTGDIIADESSIFTGELPTEPSHAGEQFEEDVVITAGAVSSEQYKGASFLGDLTIDSPFIGKNAFENVIVIGDLTIRSNMVSSEAFKNVVVAGKYSIEKPTKIIGDRAFYGFMPSTKSIILPPSLLVIGEQAFYASSWETLVLPETEQPLSIGRVAFYNPNNTEGKPRTIFLPHHHSWGNIKYGIYFKGDGVQETDIYGDDLITPNDNVYLWIDSNHLSKIFMTYGNGRLNVEESYGHVSVTGIDTQSSATATLNRGNGILYVPKGCKQKLLDYLKPAKFTPVDYSGGRFPPDPYYFFPIYSYFKEDHIVEIEMGTYPEIDESGVESISVATEAVEVARYDINGRLLNKPMQGINIVRYSDGTVKKEFVR